MSFLKKLNKKDAVKYEFTLSIESIDNFYPHGREEEGNEYNSSTSTSSSSSDSKRKSIVGKLMRNDKPTANECSYSVFWRRGSKRNGKTSFVPYRDISSSRKRKDAINNANNRLRINDVFEFTGTMFPMGKKSNKFLKKKLQFELHERLLTEEASSTGKKIATAEINLAEFIEIDQDGPLSKKINMDLIFGKEKGEGALVFNITSIMSDDPASSTSCASFSENGSDDVSNASDSDVSVNNDDWSNKKKQKPAASSALESENADLREQILYLKRKIEELQILRSGNETDSADLIIELQKERDSLRQKLKLAQIECDQMREERDKAIKEARDKAPNNKIGSKFSANIKGITNKMGIKKQEMENASNDDVEQNIERLYELEKENLRLKQQIKLLTADSRADMSLEKRDVEKEKMLHQIAELRKKVYSLESGNKRNVKSNKNEIESNNSNVDPLTHFLEEELSLFLREEILSMIPSALFRTQEQFTNADLIAARLSICKSLLNHGYLSDDFFHKMAKLLDKQLFKALMRKSNLVAGDGIKAKMTISVLEHFIAEATGEESLKKNMGQTFQRSRQCADVCILSKANILKSEEMRKIVCPDLTFENVRIICQKLGLLDN
jgi:hypothetical protein